MALLVDKIRLALGGKKTVATSLTLILVTLAGTFGLDIDPEVQKEIQIVLAALIAIFLRLGVSAGKK